MKSYLIATISVLAISAAVASMSRTKADPSITVQISGGHETDFRDRGRPVILIASALKVPAQVFRDAFSHVRPAPAGEAPDPDQVRQNKDALLGALAKFGVENDRLDEVSNYYRYNGREEELWRHREAKITATIVNGQVKKLIIVEGGSGYSSVPTLTVPGASGVKLKASIAFGTDLRTNGSISKVEILKNK